MIETKSYIYGMHGIRKSYDSRRHKTNSYIVQYESNECLFQ